MGQLISVIIPVYNAKKYLSECVESVLSQQNVSVEILLIDDGSTDGSNLMCDDFEQRYSNIIVFHTENHGVSHARNIGLDHAKGEYITFVDADDMLLPGALEQLLKMLEDHNADIAVGREQVSNLSDPSFPNAEELWQGKEGLVNSIMDHPATYSVWGKLYRASLLENIRFEEGKAVHEDSFFIFMCMTAQPKVIVRDIPVIEYRVSENSASRSAFSEKFFDILYFADRKNELIHSEYPEYIPLTENLMLKAHLALLNNLSKTRDKKYRDAERASVRYIRKHKNALIVATDNDKKIVNTVSGGLYYPKKYIKLILKGV